MAPISDIERQAYSNIYERYSQRLLGICLGYVHDIDVAKDILHDAFIIIFSRIGTLREPEKIEQWMCAIARNLSLKHIEKETGRQMWWDGLSDHEKEIVLNLPNFDKAIFKEITGIDVQ